MRWEDLDKQACPVARALSVVGDRWTLLILRDCFLGHRRFEQFQSRLGLTRHILADRLRRLETAGVLRREPYQQRPLRHEYRLTDKGKALHPVLVTLIDWANTHQAEGGPPSMRLVDAATGAPAAPVLVDAASGRLVTHRSLRAAAPSPPSPP